MQALLAQQVFEVSESTFEQTALEVFRVQYAHVPIYRAFCDSLKHTPANVSSLQHIPFLPIEFFKTHRVIADDAIPQLVFESSGTTGTVNSKHFVADTSLYEQSFLRCFEMFYGKAEEFAVLALLPSYLERGNSSLVFMAERLIQLSQQKESGFFLHDFEKLRDTLLALRERKQKTILLGVTYALLDFAELFPFQFPELIVMETGGMKGRREELTREEVHTALCASFAVDAIHSEYGMTELLSQVYSKGGGVFQSPPWMKILLRDVQDPLRLLQEEQTGAVNVIDLANLYSCSFIATGDAGRMQANGFEILGRLDSADVRGCNLLYV